MADVGEMPVLSLEGVQSATTTTADNPNWWQQLIGKVVTAAANKEFATPRLQPNQQYMVDASGRVIPMGQPSVFGAVPGAASNPLVMLAGVALLGLVVYKLVK